MAPTPEDRRKFLGALYKDRASVFEPNDDSGDSLRKGKGRKKQTRTRRSK